MLVLEHSILGSNPPPRLKLLGGGMGAGRPWSGREVSCPDLKVLGGGATGSGYYVLEYRLEFWKSSLHVGRSLVKPHTDHSKSSRLIMLELESPK